MSPKQLRGPGAHCSLTALGSEMGGGPLPLAACTAPIPGRALPVLHTGRTQGRTCPRRKKGGTRLSLFTLQWCPSTCTAAISALPAWSEQGPVLEPALPKLSLSRHRVGRLWLEALLAWSLGFQLPLHADSEAALGGGEGGSEPTELFFSQKVPGKLQTAPAPTFESHK